MLSTYFCETSAEETRLITQDLYSYLVINIDIYRKDCLWVLAVSEHFNETFA